MDKDLNKYLSREDTEKYIKDDQYNQSSGYANQNHNNQHKDIYKLKKWKLTSVEENMKLDSNILLSGK